MTVYLLTRVLNVNGWRVLTRNVDTDATTPSIQAEANQVSEVSPADEVVALCNTNATFCTDFSDIAVNFDKLSDFAQDANNPKLLNSILPIEGDPDNALLWIKSKKFLPELSFVLVTKFYDENKGNVTINYGKDWRCIFGENNHNRVVCEEQYDASDHPRYVQTLSSKGKPPIPKNSELTIKGNVTNGLNNQLNIKLFLTYFDNQGNTIEIELDDFKIKSHSANFMSLQKRFAVGIIDPLSEKIKVEFVKLEVKGGV